MYFPKSLVMLITLLLLIFAVGLIIFVYFQGGIDHAIYLRK
jgi:hypothetical protein